MARVLNEGERNIVAEALTTFVQLLGSAESTGNPVVDRLVQERRDLAAVLAEAALDATRISFTIPGEES